MEVNSILNRQFLPRSKFYFGIGLCDINMTFLLDTSLYERYAVSARFVCSHILKYLKKIQKQIIEQYVRKHSGVKEIRVSADHIYLLF